MRLPNAENFDPKPRHLRRLVEDTGLSQQECARRLGIDARTMRRYLQEPGTSGYRRPPYVLQYALEALGALRQRVK